MNEGRDGYSKFRPSGGVQAVASQEVATAGRNVEGYPGDEVQGGVAADPALNNFEGEEDQVTVACCSSQQIRCKESGSRMMYWHNASRVGWSRTRVPLSIESPERSQPRSW